MNSFEKLRMWASEVPFLPKPNTGDPYWYFDEDQEICEAIYGESYLKDEMRHVQRNMYIVFDDIQFEYERRKVLKELDMFTCKDRCLIGHPSSERFSLQYSIRNKKIIPMRSYGFLESPYIFESHKKASEAIDYIGDERLLRYYFRLLI